MTRYREWTEEEEYLQRFHDKYCIKTISEKLNRSVDAVQQKAQKMDLGKKVDSFNGLTVSNVAKIVGVPKQTICRTWVKRGLKTMKKGSFRIVNEQELVKFMVNSELPTT